jgi:uncharacterized protein (TIGR01244 family)
MESMQQDYLQMRVLELAPQVYASGQLFETDLTLLAKQGVRSIVQIRPDNESPGQPLSADLGKAAEEYGINLVYFPFDSASMSADTARAFMEACEDLERPMFVCGRSGGHSTKVWETAESM